MRWDLTTGLWGLLIAGFSATEPATAQTSPSIGGPEDPGEYSNTASESDVRPWDVNDSLRLLPGYDLYCSWETGAIFRYAPPTGRQFLDTLLVLSNSACDHAMPACGALNSDFGPRRGRMHYGLDIDLATGDPIVAAFEGVVRISRYDRSFGNVVVIRHWNGLETLYAHLSQALVSTGDLIMAGDTLGLGGSTGRSTGSHLHFEVRYLGKAIDPKFIFDVNEGVLRNRVLQVHPGLYAAASSSKSYHVVRKGETLSTIARYRGTTVPRLCELNRLRSTSLLRIGQQLRYQ